ncbi:hypothetical protein M513_11090 [Trichuris suis]|uniref:Uncharacterized protein n=1 Tax=Trichuris suis TaxID=68888 RepID=A0A085LSR2_9BILA|nr:hypothetical protein M513_11090 [Trichuris suis]
MQQNSGKSPKRRPTPKCKLWYESPSEPVTLLKHLLRNITFLCSLTNHLVIRFAAQNTSKVTTPRQPGGGQNPESRNPDSFLE